MSVSCEQCGRDFERRVSGRPRRFCEVCRPPVKRRKPRMQRSCLHCGGKFQSTRAGYCSSTCRNRAKWLRQKAENRCPKCGGPMSRRSSSSATDQTCRACKRSGNGTVSRYQSGCRCDPCRRAKKADSRAYARDHPRVGRRAGGVDTRKWIDSRIRLQIYRRDDWTCWICDGRVEMFAHFNDDLAPSLDHVVPRARGGSDDPANLRCAHRVCNSRRGVGEVADVA